MDKIIVPTKYNKTGKRILTPPLDDRKISAPAYKLYREAYRAAQAEYRRKLDLAKQNYVESMANWIASYVTGDSKPAAEKYRIVQFVVRQALEKQGPFNTEGLGSSRRWSVQIGDIPGLASIEEESWKTYMEECHKADEERDAAVAKAGMDCDEMKRVLSREVSEQVRRQNK